MVQAVSPCLARYVRGSASLMGLISFLLRRSPPARVDPRSGESRSVRHVHTHCTKALTRRLDCARNFGVIEVLPIDEFCRSSRASAKRLALLRGGLELASFSRSIAKNDEGASSRSA